MFLTSLFNLFSLFNVQRVQGWRSLPFVDTLCERGGEGDALHTASRHGWLVRWAKKREKLLRHRIGLGSRL